MINHGTTYSHTKPLSIEASGAKIFVASDIEKKIVNDENNNQVEQYSYNLAEYTVAEYLALLGAQIEEIRAEIHKK